jgi:hypothetical protein
MSKRILRRRPESRGTPLALRVEHGETIPQGDRSRDLARRGVDAVEADEADAVLMDRRGAGDPDRPVLGFHLVPKARVGEGIFCCTSAVMGSIRHTAPFSFAPAITHSPPSLIVTSPNPRSDRSRRTTSFVAGSIRTRSLTALTHTASSDMVRCVTGPAPMSISAVTLLVAGSIRSTRPPDPVEIQRAAWPGSALKRSSRGSTFVASTLAGSTRKSPAWEVTQTSPSVTATS